MSKIQQACANAIILNSKNEILFIQRSSKDDYMPGYWELPGGGIDYGENPQDGLKREVHEECGLEIEVGKPIAVNTYFIGDTQRIEITFLCKVANPQQIELSSEHTDYKWVLINEIHTLKLTDYIKNIINSSVDYVEPKK